MKRVMIGGIMHETNTFNPELTTPKKFAQRALFHGDEMFDTLCDHTVIDTQSIKPHERVQRGSRLPKPTSLRWPTTTSRATRQVTPPVI